MSAQRDCIHGHLARSCELCAAQNDHATACEQIDRLRAELAALRAEVESAHTAQRHAEKELAQYMAWYAMAEHQHLHEQRRAEKAEAEAARLRAAIEQSPHKLTCGWWGNKLDDIAGPDGKTRNCDCWKRAAIDAAMR